MLSNFVSSHRRLLLPGGLILIALASVWYVWYLNNLVVERFEGSLWKLPARVYARPLELYVGKKITPEQLEYELSALNYKEVTKLPSKPGRYHSWDNNFEIISREFMFQDGLEPGQNVRLTVDNGEITRLDELYSSTPITVLRLDPVYITGIFPAHNEDRVLLKLQEVPELFREAIIAVEDKRFYQHPGVDIRSIARAFIANVKAGRTVQGGSTITQQLVKNMFLTSEQNLWRKINEAVMALLLELHYEKDLILETYLNEVYLGQDQDRAIHGIGLASMFYFGKKVPQLSANEMALLIGMIKGASYYNPARNTERAMKRRSTVLQLMAEQGLITERQAQLLSARSIDVTMHGRRNRYPAFIDLVRRQLRQDYAEKDIQSEGLQIFTTFDPLAQRAAEDAVNKVMQQLDPGETGLQTAVVVAAPVNGNVLALVGDRQVSYNGFNRALDARRQIGSLIKPVIYLSALRKPDRYTLATLLDDTRLRVMGEDKKIWEPKNYDREYHGDVILYDALLNSRNIPAVRVGLDTGLSDIIRTLNELGSDIELPPYPSITLGAVDMSPFDVASIYQTLAANGFHSPLRSVIAVLDNNSEPVRRYTLDVNRQIDPAAISLVNFALDKITEHGTARRLSHELSINTAGKTGTSDDLRDSWFAGFTNDTVAVVWAGYDDNRPSGLTGSSGAMRVWSRLIDAVSHQSYTALLPDNITTAKIDRNTGLLAGQGCKNVVQLPFIKGSEPQDHAQCSGASSEWSGFKH